MEGDRMRVLVIGGTKFTGPHIVRSLVETGHQVMVYHRGITNIPLPPNVTEIIGNKIELHKNEDVFTQFKPDIVLHMIAITAEDAWTFVRVFAGKAGRSVVISSLDVYRAYNRLRATEPGPLDPVPFRENAPLREKLYPYRSPADGGTEPAGQNRDMEEYDKILVERIILNEPDLPGTVLRMPMIHGPNDYQHRLFPYVKRMDDRRDIILLNADHARWRCTRGYAENMAHAVFLAVTNDLSAGKTYNVGETVAWTEREWIEKIGQVAGWNGRIVALTNDALPEHLRSDADWMHHLVADTTGIRNDLGYREPVPFEEALSRTIAWERSHPPGNTGGNLFDYDAEDAAIS